MNRTICLYIFILVSFLANAKDFYDVEINGIYYILDYNSKEATVVMGASYELGGDNRYYLVSNPSYTGHVIIPETFNYNEETFTVTSIDGYSRNMIQTVSYGAFQGCENLTSVTIPKTIKKIGDRAFWGCTSLTAVYISDLSAWCNIYIDFNDNGEVSSVPYTNPLYYAHDLYLNGEKITDLFLPDDITEIKKGTFVGAGFNSVIFPKGFRNLHTSAFYLCNDIKEIYCYGPVAYAYAGGSNPATYFGNIENITLFIRERYEDNYLKTNPSSDFWNEFGEIKYIEGIDYHLIYKVDGGEYINIWHEVGDAIIPETEPTKEGYTFSGWSEIPETMPQNDVIITGSFAINKYKLTYIVNGQEYKSYDVEYNSVLTPEEYPTKKGMTFSGWGAIPETMPANDVVITGSFTWSQSTINNIIYQVSDTISNYCSVIGNDNASGEIKIDSVEIDGYYYQPTEIANKAFYGCKNITKIEIPSTVASIGERAFANIDKLMDVTIWAEEIPTTDRTAFENSYIEDYVTLHVPYVAVEKYKAVAPWKNFMSVVGIDGTQQTFDVDGSTYVITEDGATITKGTDKEGEVIIDAVVTINGKTYNVTVVGEGAFKDCTKMSSVVIPDAIKTIGTSAFEGCSHLTSINIGSGITAIAHKAFANIGSAANAPRRVGEVGLTVSCAAEAIPTADSDVFENTDLANATLLVNDNLVDSYKATSPWSQFGNIIGFNEASGIDSILSVQQGAAIYSIDGRRLANIQKGLNIIKTIDGRTKKIVVR